MALFSSLANHTALQSSSTTNESSSISTVVQLYTSRYVSFVANLTSCMEDAAAGVVQRRRFEVLSYQAVSTDSNNSRPNLGVWDCHVSNDVRTAVSVLDNVFQDAPNTNVFVVTIDLDQEELVSTSVQTMVQCLVAHILNFPTTTTTTTTENNKEKEGGIAITTRVSKLQSTVFGEAPSHRRGSTTPAGEEDDELTIGIVLCAILPPAKTTYKEKQAQALLSYHLHKYASELNCTLCFVARSDSPQEEGMTIKDLASFLKTIFCSEITKDETLIITDEEEEMKQTFVHVPNSHDVDVIDSVMLRNAGYPGVWDATVDDLWVALPPPTTLQLPPTIAVITPPKVSVGDEDWLSKLADSVFLPIMDEESIVRSNKVVIMEPFVAKSASKKGKKLASSGLSSPPGKKTDDMAVSSFFENLLKK